MRNIRPVLELLENEQLTVVEAERFIEAIVERGERPQLPAGDGRLQVCAVCGERMCNHDVFNRCPVRRV